MPDSLIPIRALYLEAVEDEAAIARGFEAIERAREVWEAAEGSEADAVLSAYRGALVTLRAKHGVWPPSRLSHLREGLRMLDAAVASHPDQAEIRYLRLLSCYFLPGILGRSGSVREDFDALARLLPGARASFPPELYDTMVRFVLERGEVDAQAQGELQEALGVAGDG
jgi:hypothetical protein